MMRLKILVATASLMIAASTPAAATTFFSEDFEGKSLGSGETITGDYHVDRGVLVTSDPYPNGDRARFEANVDLTAASSAYLSFAVNYKTEACCDPFNVTINGMEVYQRSGGEIYGGGPFLSDQPTLNLSSYLGSAVTVAFMFQSDGSIVSDGVQLDNLKVTSNAITAPPVSFDATSAVPETATWAMMILGFGVIGFGLRRARKADDRFTDKVRTVALS